jgi:magnesium transporter
MAFELTKDILADIKETVASGQQEALLELLSDVHAADVAEILDHVDIRTASTIYRSLEHEFSADVLLELDEDLREKILEELSSKEIAEHVIENIDSDDAADVISELSEQKAKEVLEHVENDVSDEIEELLGYEEGSVGSIMAKEMITTQAGWSVKRAIIEMRKQSEDVEKIYTIYVVDAAGKLTGWLSLKDLLFTSESTRSEISDLATSDIHTLSPHEDAEDAVDKLKKYDLVTMPVVDDDGVLLGRVTFDDAMDVMEEEAEKDYQMASGISEAVESDDSVLKLTRARLPWLVIGLIGGILVAQVIALYEEQLRIDPRLAFFIPLIAAMGGNVGVQSSAIIVQGLANRTIKTHSIVSRLSKELLVGLLNAAVCGSLLLLFNIVMGSTGALSYTVSIALFAVIIFAALFGTVTPLVLDRFKVDPALATGPFITTMNDIMGLLVYFWVGKMFYEAMPPLG